MDGEINVDYVFTCRYSIKMIFLIIQLSNLFYFMWTDIDYKLVILLLIGIGLFYSAKRLSK